MERHPIEVAKKLCGIIPKEHNSKFHEIASIAIEPYKAPEQYHYLWDDLRLEMNKVCKYPQKLTMSWQIKAVATLMDQSEDFIKENFSK